MRIRGVSVLVGLTLVIAAGTLIQNLRFGSVLARERAAALSVDRQFGSLSVALANLRAAQAGYLADGQDPAYWMAQVNELSTEVDAVIRRRQAAARDETTRKHYESAASALAAFIAVDGRARGYVRTDQLQASDLIFVNSIESIARLTSALDAARSAEVVLSEGRLSRVNLLQTVMNIIAIIFLTAVAMFLWRAATGRVDEVAAREPASPIPHISQPPPPPAPGLSLADAAAVCADLAKVVDSRDVPALFDRAAAVLAAKGAVLWLPDPGGAMLRPSLTHGYSERVLAKMGPLQVDAENLTSLAYRSMRPQTVNGDAPGSPGAIAVPLLSSSGCVGVLAAETRLQKPGHDVVPVAQMIAAQLAALVTPETAGQKIG
jgi:hypothetical protein